MQEEEQIDVIRYGRKMLGRKSFNCGIESLDDFIEKRTT